MAEYALAEDEKMVYLFQLDPTTSKKLLINKRSNPAGPTLLKGASISPREIQSEHPNVQFYSTSRELVEPIKKSLGTQDLIAMRFIEMLEM